MSTFPYTRSAATVRKLLKRFGRSVTVKSRSTTTPAGEPWEDGGKEAVTSIVTNAVFLDEVLAGQADDPRYQAWIGKIFLEAPLDGTDLRPFRVIRDGTRHVELSSIDPLKPGDLDIMYIASKKGG